MQTRPLGATGRPVPAISLGGYSFQDAAARDRHVAVVRRAVELGATLIDTAPGYGSSEETIGIALEGIARDKVFLSSKYYPYGEGDKLNPSAGDFERTLERTLARLKTDHLDLIHLHWVHSAEDIRKILATPLAGALRKAQAAGKVRMLAVSEASEMDGTHSMLEAAIPLRFFDSVMVTYNVFLPNAESGVLPLALQHGTGVLVMMPLNQPAGGSGLTGAAGAAENIRRLRAEGQVPEEVPYTDPDLINFLTAGTKLNIPQAALRYVLDHPGVSSALVGTASVEHLEESLKAADAPPLAKPVHARVHELFGRVKKHIK